MQPSYLRSRQARRDRMATEGSGAAREAPAMTSLPSVEDLPVRERGFDEHAVREAFDSFRRHVVQLQAQLRVLQAAGRTGQAEPTGHAVRMDSLHLIREAAEFADVLERDAQRASAAQFQRTEQEVRQKQVELQQREAEVQRYHDESERQRLEIVASARNEARGTRLLEQARHQATELTNATRAEVEQTLEWARAQASAVITRAQQGAEQVLAAAGLGEAAANEVAETIAKSAEASAQATRVGEPEQREPTGDEATAGPQSIGPAPAPSAPAPAQAQPPEGPQPPSTAPEPQESPKPPSDSGDTNA